MKSDSNIKPLFRIKVKLALSHINLGIPNEALSWSKMFETVISRALLDKGILAEMPATDWMNTFGVAAAPAFVCAIGCEAMGVFGVTDLAAGLITIRAELEYLHLLSRAEIGWLDSSGKIWLYFYPEGKRKQMESDKATTLAWMVQVNDRLKAAQGL